MPQSVHRAQAAALASGRRVKAVHYLTPSDPMLEAATGAAYHSDDRVLVVVPE